MFYFILSRLVLAWVAIAFLRSLFMAWRGEWPWGNVLVGGAVLAYFLLAEFSPGFRRRIAPLLDWVPGPPWFKGVLAGLVTLLLLNRLGLL